MSKEKLETGCKTKKSTLEKKTGSWRTFKPIVTDKCSGCSICIPLCPEGCITLVDTPNRKFKKTAKIDYNYCKGCLICLNECPFKAIKKEEEK